MRMPARCSTAPCCSSLQYTGHPPADPQFHRRLVEHNPVTLHEFGKVPRELHGLVRHVRDRRRAHVHVGHVAPCHAEDNDPEGGSSGRITDVVTQARIDLVAQDRGSQIGDLALLRRVQASQTATALKPSMGETDTSRAADRRPGRYRRHASSCCCSRPVSSPARCCSAGPAPLSGLCVCRSLASPVRSRRSIMASVSGPMRWNAVAHRPHG